MSNSVGATLHIVWPVATECSWSDRNASTTYSRILYVGLYTRESVKAMTICPHLELPLTSSFCSRTRPSTVTSINTGCQWRRTGDGSAGTWGPKGQGLEQAPPPLYMYIFRSISRLASGQIKSRKRQVSINSNNSSTGCKKTATGNGNLQPEIQSNEYSSSEKITRVVCDSSSTRVLAAALSSSSPHPHNFRNRNSFEVQ